MRLKTGLTVLLGDRKGRVVRVTDCSAAIELTKPVKEFTTLFGVRVRIQGATEIVHISPYSELPILKEG